MWTLFRNIFALSVSNARKTNENFEWSTFAYINGGNRAREKFYSSREQFRNLPWRLISRALRQQLLRTRVQKYCSRTFKKLLPCKMKSVFMRSQTALVPGCPMSLFVNVTQTFTFETFKSVKSRMVMHNRWWRLSACLLPSKHNYAGIVARRAFITCFNLMLILFRIKKLPLEDV